MKKILYLFMISLVFAYVPGKAIEETSASSKGELIKVGASGSQFLKIGVGARGSAMGAYCSVTNDLSSMYWNPAGLADYKKIGLEADYTQWIAGFKHIFGGFAMPLGSSFTIGASLTSFQSDDIEITTLKSPEGTGHYYQANDMAASVCFAGYLTEEFSFGINAKYLYNGFESVSSTGFAFDIGTMYNTGLYGIKIAFALSNLGTRMQYTGAGLKNNVDIDPENVDVRPVEAELSAQSYSIPLIFRAGLSTDKLINDEDNKLIVAADFATYSDVSEQYTLGAEYTYKKLISVRGSYIFGHDQLGLAGGIGLNWEAGNDMKVNFDYSINPTADLGLINRLSINVGL